MAGRSMAPRTRNTPICLRHATQQLELLLCRWVWVGVGFLLAAIVLFHVIIILAQKFLGPLGNNAAVLSEEALRARDIALYGQSGKGGVDDTIVDVDEQVQLSDYSPVRFCIFVDFHCLLFSCLCLLCTVLFADMVQHRQTVEDVEEAACRDSKQLCCQVLEAARRASHPDSLPRKVRAWGSAHAISV